MPIYEIEGVAPRIDADAFVHPDAVVIGDVTIGAESSVWPGAVLRGDYGTITVGARILHSRRHRRACRSRDSPPSSATAAWSDT